MCGWDIVRQTFEILHLTFCEVAGAGGNGGGARGLLTTALVDKLVVTSGEQESG